MDSAEVSTLCLAHLPAHALCSKLEAALADFELSPFRGIALRGLAHNENLSPLRLSRRLYVTLQAKAELNTSHSILRNAIAARRERPVDKRKAHHRRHMCMQSNESGQ